MTHPGFRLSTGPLLGILLLAGLTAYLSFHPLGHTDVWAHAKYGEWYCTHQSSPGVEPLSPFSDKQAPFADVAWLSQVTYYLLYRLGASTADGDAESRLLGGAEALRSFHLLLLVARFVLLWLALKRFGGSWTWAALGVFLYLMTVGFGSAVQRPQAFGLFFFTAIIYALSSPTLSRPALIWLPFMFLVWANLHGTFTAGLMVLGLHTAGRATELGLRGREVWRLVTVGLLCSLATLANPHGVFLYQQIITFSGHPNLKTMTEWFPMRVSAASGNHWPYLMGLLLLAFVRILGGRRIGAAGWFVAIPFAVWPWFQGRMILWWWTIAVWLLARLGPGLADRFPTLPSLPDRPPTRANAGVAVVAILGAVLVFPPVRALLPGVKHDLDHTVQPATPWRLAMELTADPAHAGHWFPELRSELRASYPDGRFRGTIFASETQGDFLVWALPPDVPVTMFTHAHVFSPEYWNACLDVMAAAPGWREFLARHRANLIVLETETHAELVAELRNDPDWTIVMDGPPTPGSPILVLVAVRKQPL